MAAVIDLGVGRQCAARSIGQADEMNWPDSAASVGQAPYGLPLSLRLSRELINSLTMMRARSALPVFDLSSAMFLPQSGPANRIMVHDLRCSFLGATRFFAPDDLCRLVFSQP